RPPPRRLGDAVGGALPGCPLWVPAPAVYPSAQPHVVLRAATGPHRPRVPLFPDVHRSLWGDPDSHVDRQGWDINSDGAMERSATGNRGRRVGLRPQVDRRPEMFKTKNDLPEATRAKAVELLNARLADCIDLQTQTKQAHWNVKGPTFIALHELFDKINEEV